MTTITLLENLRAVFYAPFYVAIERGYFDDEGVELRFLPSPDPGDTLPRLLAGEVDVCWGGPLRVLRAHDEDRDCPLVCFAEVVGRDPFLLVGRGFGDEFSMSDLIGKRLGVVSEVPTPWLCLRQDLRDAGIEATQIEVVTGLSMGENESALARGDLDVFQAFQPFAERAAQRSDANVIYAGAARGPTLYTTFYTTRQAVEQHREALRAMARACRRAVRALYDEGGVGAVPALAHYFPDLPEALLRASVDRYLSVGLYSPTGTISEAGFEQLKRSMLSAGFIRSGASFLSCVDNSLVDG